MTGWYTYDGDTFKATVTWTDPDGDPINLTGYTVTAQIRSAGETYDYTEGDGLVVTDLSGQIELTSPAADTTAFTNPTYVTVVVVSPSMERTTLFDKRVEIL